jgi:manganese efflux pump family protein
MPIVGLLLGRSLAAGLGPAARWTGAALLIATGLSVLVQARRERDRPDPGEDDRARGREPARPGASQRTGRLLVTGAALSIDNLAVGFALGTLRVPFVLAVIVIGSVSVAMSLAGLELGRRIGAAAGERGELLSGVVLIGVGIAAACGLF